MQIFNEPNLLLTWMDISLSIYVYTNEEDNDALSIIVLFYHLIFSYF